MIAGVTLRQAQGDHDRLRVLVENSGHGELVKNSGHGELVEP